MTNASHAIHENRIIEIGLEAMSFDKSIKTQYPDFLPGRYARILVSDNGRGIAKENLNMIFDPYFTTKDLYKGTGLELFVVHGIVEIYGGHITVYSEVGRGTTYLFICPWPNNFLRPAITFAIRAAAGRYCNASDGIGVFLKLY